MITQEIHAFPRGETHMTQAMERLKNDYGPLLHETVLTNTQKIINQAQREPTTKS